VEGVAAQVVRRVGAKTRVARGRTDANA
jgi:hypothetical protein